MPFSGRTSAWEEESCFYNAMPHMYSLATPLSDIEAVTRNWSHSGAFTKLQRHPLQGHGLSKG